MTSVLSVKSSPLGSAPVRSAQAALSGHPGPVMILYGDTPLLRTETLRALVQAYEAAGAPLARCRRAPAMVNPSR